MKLETILVGMDFSPASQAAGRRACAIAGEKGKVQLVNVVNTDLLPRHGFLGKDIVERFFAGLRDEAQGRLTDAAKELAQTGAHLETVVRSGRPADEIVAASAQADMIVLGAHARDVLGRLVLGSVAEEVARRSPVPTLVVRETAVGSSQVQRVLVAVDVVEPEPRAIEAASLLASRLGAKLEAIHVVSLPIMPAYRGGAAMAQVASDIEAKIRADAPKVVRSIISKAIGQHAAIHIAYGSPWREIVRYARPTDLLVCSTHGRGAIGRFAFGSVATKLARRAPCPVLVVRPEGS